MIYILFSVCFSNVHLSCEIMKKAINCNEKKINGHVKNIVYADLMSTNKENVYKKKFFKDEVVYENGFYIPAVQKELQNSYREEHNDIYGKVFYPEIDVNSEITQYQECMNYKYSCVKMHEANSSVIKASIEILK